MRVSIGWLKEYVEFPWSAEELADRLTMSGAKVEGITRLGEGLKGVVVGEIVEAAKHPESEALFVCTVRAGERTVQSVTGAPNARAGIRVPVALPGASLPGLDGVVRTGEVRGVASEAVLCSERELGISDDHSGLMELPDTLTPGDDLVAALGLDDAVIEFEIYPNRPDCLSVIGLAREVAALTGDRLRLPEADVPEANPSIEQETRVDVADPDLCTRYLARVVHGVKIGPSPAWMQQRLRAAGMRPINNVVDITNYVMLELGQPLHAFDFERLRERRILVRRAKEGETLRTLDGVERRFTGDDLLICDGEGPVAIAGVMGGESSEVSDETTSVLLEAATFDPVAVRKTSRRLGLRTEASLRFEKDLDPRLAAWAIDRAARLLAAHASGTVCRGKIDVCSGLPEPRTLELRPKRVNAMLGTSLSPAEMKRILGHLEFEVEFSGGAEVIRVTAPTFRRDIEREADLIEEIARIYGYDKIEPTLPTGASVQGGLSWPLPALAKVRHRLASAGLDESLTYSFISAKSFDRLQLPPDHPWRRAIPLANPLSEEQGVMRTTLVPSLLEAVATNVRRQNADVALFEIGRVYLAASLPLNSLPEERRTLGIVLTGRPPGLVWGDRERQVDFFDLKGLVEAAAEALGVRLSFAPSAHPGFHPGRTAEVQMDGAAVGVAGEVHPKALEAYDLRSRVYIAELDLDALSKVEKAAKAFVPLPKYPAVVRDLALLVPKDVPAADVVRLIKREGGERLRRVDLFDVYEGEQVPDGYRSIAYTMSFQASDRTLTDDEIAEAQRRIETALRTELSVSVRG